MHILRKRHGPGGYGFHAGVIHRAIGNPVQADAIKRHSGNLFFGEAAGDFFSRTHPYLFYNDDLASMPLPDQLGRIFLMKRLIDYTSTSCESQSQNYVRIQIPNFFLHS